MEMSTKHAIRIPRMERIGIMQSRTCHSCHQLCKRQKPGLCQRSCNHYNHQDWKARDSASADRRSKTFRIIGRWCVSTSISWISAGKSHASLQVMFRVFDRNSPWEVSRNWMAWIYWVVSWMVGLTFDPPWLDSTMKSNVSDRNVFQLTYPEPEVLKTWNLKPWWLKQKNGISFSSD